MGNFHVCKGFVDACGNELGPDGGTGFKEKCRYRAEGANGGVRIRNDGLQRVKWWWIQHLGLPFIAGTFHIT